MEERLKKLIESSNKQEYIPFSELQKILGEDYKIIDNPKWKTSCKNLGEKNER